MSRHTPGPWEAKRDNRRSARWRVESADAWVADIVQAIPGDDPEMEANARLIAAAPDLLAALRGFVTETRAYQSPECEECPIFGPLLREADAAIAKAEGST